MGNIHDHFYADLPAHELSVNDLLDKKELFVRIPGEWHVIITDIKNSTGAVSKGLHDQVNLVATGSIIAALNIARKSETTIPFFFGGDGATMIIPVAILDSVIQALLVHKDNTFRNFNLDLRVGQVPVSAIYQAGFELVISKVKMSEIFAIPIVLGGGLQYAERIIKEGDPRDQPENTGDGMLDLEGMECRWDRIKPPEDTFEVISLLVVAQDDTKQAAVFKKVLDHIDAIYGSPSKRKPISVKKLRLKPTLAKVRTEMWARLGKFNIFYLLGAWLGTLIGKFYFFPFDRAGKRYLRTLVQLADTFVLDGRINTVMSGTIRQREELRTALENMEADGEIFFGLYASEESILSCYVRDRADQHIHFVDGSEGGYTAAARMLKQKLRSV